MLELDTKDVDILTNGFGNKYSFYRHQDYDLYVLNISEKDSKEVLNLQISPNKKYLEIFELCVSDEFKNKSIGKKMINNIMDFMEHKNINEINLDASKIGSHFWAKAGFIPKDYDSYNDLKTLVKNALLKLEIKGEISAETSKNLLIF